MGISSAKVIRKAEEYARLSQVKCTALNNVTSTCEAVICLDLAATYMKLPLDKEYAIRLSGITKKLYQSNLKAMQCLLGLEHHLGLSELGVQYGCMDAVGVAAQILERYKTSLPSVQQQDLDMSKPLFTTTALYSACRCLKIKVDKKLTGSSGAKKAVFDRLSVQFHSFGQEICKKVTTKMPQKKAPKRLKPMENIETMDEDCLPSSLKQQKEKEEDEEEDGMKKTAQDYEEWKRKILENALKSNAETCDS
ncbi:Origin recognition complex subunit 6 [Merluccius polli]|uniref:Origin recognition complex subunit 6 n=1 Tax=Merluccius polli TaxID=89951 RepID=A0AA47NXC0_MERPO|nr:Origin recognition complex subunit 6 [Merluccius polli]